MLSCQYLHAITGNITKQRFSTMNSIHYSSRLLVAVSLALPLSLPLPAFAQQTINIDSNVPDDDVYGNSNSPDGLGYPGKNPNNNTVNINSGGNVTGGHLSGGHVFGAMYTATEPAEHAAVTGNIVNINGGTTDNAYGGVVISTVDNFGTATATNNTVNITSGTVNDDVAGGSAESYGAAAARNNTVNISGGTLHYRIFGGYAESNNAASATHNTITISGSPDLSGASLYGGDGAGKSGSDFRTGNTLKLLNTRGITVGLVKNFENFHFLLPADIANGDTLLTADEAILGEKANISLALNSKPTSTTSIINLIKADSHLEGTLGVDAATRITTHATYGATDYIFDIDKDNGTASDRGNLTARFTGEHTVNQRLAANYIYGAAARVAALNNAVDHSIGLIDNRRLSSGGIKEGFSGFTSMQGSAIKTKTGSSVDNDGISFLAGGTWDIAADDGKFLIGAFAEGGIGNYDAHSQFGRGDGDTWHYGVGGFGKFQFNSGTYVDASVRFGRVKTEYDNKHNNLLGYDSKTNYWGAHAGAGHEYALSETGTLDGYLKVLWTTQASDTVTTQAQEKLHFDSVDSLRTRLGCRYIHTTGSGLKAWGGLAWEHEFDGETKARLDGQRIRHSTKPDGETAIAEVGAEYNSNRWRLTGSVQGMFGQHEGVAGMLAANYKF
jgi:outer membrane autotransporter protein